MVEASGLVGEDGQSLSRHRTEGGSLTHNVSRQGRGQALADVDHPFCVGDLAIDKALKMCVISRLFLGTAEDRDAKQHTDVVRIVGQVGSHVCSTVVLRLFLNVSPVRR